MAEDILQVKLILLNPHKLGEVDSIQPIHFDNETSMMSLRLFDHLNHDFFTADLLFVQSYQNILDYTSTQTIQNYIGI